MGLDLSDLTLILVSPNLSEEMGGEAIKALQIHLSLVRQGARVHQITHERVRNEIQSKWPAMKVSYVKDTWLQKNAFRLGQLNPVLSVVTGSIIAFAFQRKAAQMAGELVQHQPDAVVHYTSPVSPVMPYFAIPRSKVVIGPLNGNIHYPRTFRHREPLPDRLRLWFHSVLQRMQVHAFPGKRQAAALLVAGGDRTRRSLLQSGCREKQFVESLDSGVLDRLWKAPRIVQTGRNLRFVHNGRLVPHKGVDLAIRSLKRTRKPIQLDIIGRGPEVHKLEALVTALELGDRVKFLGWIEDHNKVSEALSEYRGFVFPSLAEANGIVVQEAMVMGLPVIALNWGGPALLVTPETGILIDPRSEDYVIEELAKAMDRLGEDGVLAERLSIAGRESASENGFMWSSLIQRWARVYRGLALPSDGPSSIMSCGS